MVFKLTYIFLLSALCAVFFNVNAQKSLTTKSKKAIAFYEEAKGFYVNNQFRDAILSLDDAIAKDDRFIEAYIFKADICEIIKKYELQEEALKKTLEIDSMYFIPTYYNMGILMYNTGRYNEVEPWMKRFTNNMGTRRTKLNPQSWIDKAAFAQKAIDHPNPYNPVNLGPSINSEYDEYWPSISADGENIVFTVLVPNDILKFSQGDLPKNPMNFQEDFYQSYLKQEGWSARTAITSINTDSNEGAQALSADGHWMFFASCNRPDSKGSCDIYFSRRTIEGWSKPINIGIPVNSPYGETQPSFSADGKTLYFISNRPGGIGKNDIWKSEIISFLSNGCPVFSKPENLGEAINSPLSESSPFIHHDNQTLYFSSKGWLGFGEMDLFVSRRDSNGNWTEAVNLGYPINSNRDEIGLVINAEGNKGYFSSDGLSDTKNGKDIYEFELPENVKPQKTTYVKGTVYDKETQRPLGAHLRIFRIEDGQDISVSESTSFSGEFLFCLPIGSSYGLKVNKEGYLFYSDHFNVSESATIENPKKLKVYLSKIKKDEVVVLNNVFFDHDSYALKMTSYHELDDVILFLNSNPAITIEFGGHTDNVGDANYNMELSQKRAKAVYDYIISKNIPKDRVSFMGYGMNQPLMSNDTEEGKAKNRRTEIKVL